jgi:hypothetical protein
MSEFETSGSVAIEVDQQSLRQARDEVESSIGDVTVGVSGGQARTDGGSTRARRRARVMRRAAETQVDELATQTDTLGNIEKLLADGLEESGGGGGGDGGNTISNTAMLEVQRRTLAAQRDSADFDKERNKLLVEMVDLLDEGVDGGGGGGSGGGSFTGGLTGGLAARTLGGLGLGGGLGLLGAGGIGAGLGLAGVRGLQETGVTEDVREAGQQTGETLDNVPGGSAARDAAPFLTAGTSDAGAAALDLAQGDFSFSNFRELQQQRRDIIDRRDSGSAGDVPLAETPTGPFGVSPGGVRSIAGEGQLAQDPPFFQPGGGRSEDSPFFRPAGPGAASAPGNNRITSPVSQQDGLLGATARAQPGAGLFGAGADRSTPGGIATAGRSRPPDAVGGGGSDVNVTAPVDARVEVSLGNIERELDRLGEQIKNEVLRELRQQSGVSDISAAQQRSFQRRT